MSDEKKKASIRCKCGTVSIELAGSKCLGSAACCCVDCYQRYDHYASLGGPPVPEAIAKREKPNACYYFPNRLMNVKGKDKITFSRLRADGNTVHMVASCCHSILVTDHPMYGGNVVSLFPAYGGYEGEPEDSVFFYSSVRDWPDEEYAKLPKDEAHLYFTATGPAGSEDPPFMPAFVKFQECLATASPELLEGVTTFQSLLEELGGEVKNLELTPLVPAYKNETTA